MLLELQTIQKYRVEGMFEKKTVVGVSIRIYKCIIIFFFTRLVFTTVNIF